MINFRRGLGCPAPAFPALVFAALLLSMLVGPLSGIAQGQAIGLEPPGADAVLLPDAPTPQPPDTAGANGATGAAGVALPQFHRHSRVIQPGQSAHPLSGRQKAILSLRESAGPLNLVTSVYSASYEQLTGDDPKYGSDSGAFADKFGAAMARAASVRIFSDGVFATAFHQDPRYYRIGSGSIWSRGLRSAEQALVRHADDGDEEINSSGLAGRAVAATLTLAYYPPASRKAGVVLSTFGVSMATDAGGDLVLEFFPDLARKFPVLKRLQIQ